MDSRLIEALADCLEQSDNGAPIEDCLSRYATERAELEPLLRVSAALRDLPVPPPLNLARLEQSVLARAAVLRAAPASPAATSVPISTQAFPSWALPLLLMVLLIALMVAIVALIVQPSQPTITHTAMPTATSSFTQTPEATLFFTLTPVTDPLPTHSLTNTPSATPLLVSATPSATAISESTTATAPPPPTPSDDDDGDDDDDDDDDDDGEDDVGSNF
jgi:hypothetical protein